MNKAIRIKKYFKMVMFISVLIFVLVVLFNFRSRIKRIEQDNINLKAVDNTRQWECYIREGYYKIEFENSKGKWEERYIHFDSKEKAFKWLYEEQLLRYYKSCSWEDNWHEIPKP